MAATAAACQAIWLQDLLGEILNKTQEKAHPDRRIQRNWAWHSRYFKCKQAFSQYHDVISTYGNPTLPFLSSHLQGFNFLSLQTPPSLSLSLS
ncbi:hypothetical protein L2E82_00381 [Cichorium intybus]|uniref:Uncharacterized protein n=1 Tax=Cichorium intybus TaxID=13427 RepID=A0ACB9GXX9_CICIN|nr:hypothetical protein L2E82_00381 [Cichorium intybus]